MMPQIYVGLLLTTLATLMYEVLLPRILSVTMFYHFAFMAVSLAMFGMTVGAVVVHLRPERYTPARAREDLTTYAALHAGALILSFAIYLRIPFFDPTNVVAMLGIAATYVVLAVPFVFSGITVAIALTRFPRHLPSLYAADLVGAALGCIAVFIGLEWTDAPTAVVVAGVIAAAGAAAFAWNGRRRWATVGLTGILAVAGVSNHVASARGHGWLDLGARVLWGVTVDYRRWNAHSYVEVFPVGEPSSMALGWGMSSTLPSSFKIHEHSISIDEKAGTGIVEFHGDTKPLEFLRYDITNAAHQIRKNADVCVIGVGGGRDILSALYFDQNAVVGIELNDIEIGLLRGKYADFSGHLDQNPKVTLVRDEARSYLARSDRQFDILQISLIDTFAATAAGAFTLAENSLYTVDAWNVFLKRLKPHGVLTVSRYFFHRRPGEVYRSLSLATAALERSGVKDPRSHLFILKNQVSMMVADAGIGTLLVSKDPFSESDIAKLNDYARDMDFEVVLSPSHAADWVFDTIANGKNLDSFYENYPIDISPIDDDRPFFFQMLRMRDVAHSSAWNARDINWKNLRALIVLLSLLVVVVVLTALCVIVPLALRATTLSLRRSAPMLLYFAAIGFGFMFIEMAQMQRLTIFLGHPSYALSVVLFTLLLASGAGSYLAGLVERRNPGALNGVFGLLFALLVAVGIATPFVTTHLAAWSTPSRIAVSVALLGLLGLPMGMPFPLGMRRAGNGSAPLAWYWGINGAASVCCSVIAMILALSFGISVTYWAGLLSYAVAALVHVFAPAEVTVAR